MKVEIIKYPTEEDWLLVKQCTLCTVGKETDKPATDKFKRGILKARHSPIRELRFVFRLTDIPYWVSVHLCRHVHAQPYVKTQRNDRQTAYDRNSAPQNAPVNMMWSMNAETLITIANKRLCNLASKETRLLVREICRQVVEVCPEFSEELVPMCVRNGGVCYEMSPCGERINGGITVALNKQIPQKPYIVRRNGNRVFAAKCPRCRSSFPDIGGIAEFYDECEQPDYCGNCGQAIDWENDNG